MAKKEFKNKTIERKIYFYKVVCLVDGKEQNLKEVFDSYINLLDSNYENLEERGLAIPFFDKYHFLDVEAQMKIYIMESFIVCVRQIFLIYLI